MKWKYSAFTLAEVLITLGIIGVVAAMTLPAVINKTKQIENETKLKKTYSMLSQALLRSVAKDGDLTALNISDADNNSIPNWYKYYLKPYIKVTKECYDEAGCWHEGNTKALNGGSVYYDMGSVGIGANIVNFVTVDGVVVNVDSYGFESGYAYFGVNSTTDVLVFFVDVNAKQNPNQIGKDIFVFVFTNKGLVPAGKDMTQEQVDSNCSPSGSGYFCARKIMQNGWKFGEVNL